MIRKSKAYKEGQKRYKSGKDPLWFSPYPLEHPDYPDFHKGWRSKEAVEAYENFCKETGGGSGY